MTTTRELTAHSTKQRVARLISTVFHPLVQVFVVLPLIGGQFGSRGLALGVLAATFIAGIPGAVLWWYVRRGRLSDMDVSDRAQRPLVLGLSLASLVVGVALLLVLHAPRTLLTVIAGMAAGVAVSAVVSRVWKASIHAAVTAGSIVILGGLVSPAFFALTPAAVAVDWARVAKGDHSTPQVLVGTVVGAAIAAVTVLAART